VQVACVAQRAKTAILFHASQRHDASARSSLDGGGFAPPFTRGHNYMDQHQNRWKLSLRGKMLLRSDRFSD
jgi:hypothetical protein